MSIVLAEIDSTCSYLGSFVDDEYKITSDSISCLKHLIWFLRHDGDTHDYRRHIGQSKILQKDLLPMLVSNSDNLDLSYVLLRLLVNLSYPALLLYREELPKDGPGRRNFLEIIEILQSYKEAFASKQVWVILGVYLQKVLEIDVALRADSHSLLIERVLSLIRNILQVPVNPSTENRADNDASVHDQVLWSLQQSGVLDLILYILASEFENVYHLHALEIIYLVYREQTPESLANALMQRSETEKQQDEQELISMLRREKEEKLKQIPNSRHSRFGGCYVLKDVKSISENDLISHQPIDKAYKMEFDREKNRKKKSHRIVKEENVVHRRSAFSIRLFLREFCLEILHSAFNNFVASIRATVQRETSGGHDDSYLLWAMSFFMEFNRLSNFRLELISESLSLTSFHWVLTRIQFNMDMITSDKKNSRLWSRRLHLGIKAYNELLYSLNTLQKFKDDDKSQGLYRMIQNNIFYVLEHRETMLHLIINYKEANSTKAYLRDVIETAHTFFKMMEKFSAGGIVVQQKKRRKNKPNSQKNDNRRNNDDDEQEESDNEQLENKWAHLMTQLSIVLSNENLKLPGDNEIVPFDATSDKPIDDQKEDCMLKIYEYLKEEQYEHAVCMLRAGREVWMEDDCFGSFTSAPEDELMILKEIFFSNLSYKKGECEPCNAQQDIFIERLKTAAEAENIEEVTYSYWISVINTYKLEKITTPIEEIIEILSSSPKFCLAALRKHDYIARQQSNYLQIVKCNLQDGEYVVILDFSENYKFVTQNEIQAAHYYKHQATLFPIVAYYKSASDKQNIISYAIISETHDTVAVYGFQKKFIEFLESKKFVYPAPKKIYYFSDGAVSQFKNKKNFANINHHEMDFKVDCEWNFFATSHGKGPSDGVGGTVKRLATAASLRSVDESLFNNSKEFFDWCKVKSGITSIHFDYVTKTEYTKTEKHLNKRFSKLKTVDNTRQIHQVMPTVNKQFIKTKMYSNSDIVNKCSLY